LYCLFTEPSIYQKNGDRKYKYLEERKGGRINEKNKKVK